MNPHYEANADEDAAVRRDRLEDLFEMEKSEALAEAINYEPVMYKLANEMDSKSSRDESLVEI